MRWQSAASTPLWSARKSIDVSNRPVHLKAPSTPAEAGSAGTLHRITGDELTAALRLGRRQIETSRSGEHPVCRRAWLPARRWRKPHLIEIGRTFVRLLTIPAPMIRTAGCRPPRQAETPDATFQRGIDLSNRSTQSSSGAVLLTPYPVHTPSCTCPSLRSTRSGRPLCM